MRVGGRINKEDLPYHDRHPMILPINDFYPPPNFYPLTPIDQNHRESVPQKTADLVRN